MASKDSLAIILPVYNESGAIEDVLMTWMAELKKLGIKDFAIHVYNDGSKDQSLDIMRNFAAKHPAVVVHDKTNSGHGPTILQGYRENAAHYEWLFQTDSDGELRIDCFGKLWEQRDQYDFLVGVRMGYHQSEPLPRKIVSFVSRLSVAIFYRRSIWDVNTAYRLMRSCKFEKVFSSIPSDTFAPNVIISGMAGVLNLPFFECPVPYEPRTTGVGSISKIKLFKIAARSFFQTICFACREKKKITDGK